MKKGKLIGKIFGIALALVLIGTMFGGLSSDTVHATDLDLSFLSAPVLATGENEGGSPAQSALGTIYFTIGDPGGGDQPSMTYIHTETYLTSDPCKLQVCLQDVGVNPNPEPPSWADDIANVYVDGVLIGTYDSVHNRLPYPGPGPVQFFTSDLLVTGTHTITVEIVYSYVAGSMFAEDITAASTDTTPPGVVSDLSATAIDLTRTGFAFPTGKKPIHDPPVSYGYGGAYTYYDYAGWLARGDKGDYVAHKYHIGQDIGGDEDDAVYAIKDGEIVLIHYDADGTKGWGQGNYGLFVKHELNTGEKFLALYGHVRPLEGKSFAVGQQVISGRPFAKIGPFNPPHLHFGICCSEEVPGTYIDPANPRNNIGWGRMGLNHWDENWPDKTNYFVDPIKWITTQTPESPLEPAAVVLSWTAPADDGNDVGSGPASDYDIRYSASPIMTDEEWESATQCVGEPQPGDPGDIDSFAVTGLFAATAYHFALKAYDEAGNPSGLSNVPWEITPGIRPYLCSPADMIVTDPDGLTINKELNEIPGATYIEIDINGDGDPDDVVNIPDRKIGHYLITVIPEPGVSPTDTYTLGVSAGGVTIVLAENVQIADIPSEGYIVRLTETEVMQIIPATIDFVPDVLNRKAKAKYVTAHIELPTGYDVSQIDISSIRLNDTVPALSKPTAIGDYDNDGIPDLMVKFDKAAVQDALTMGEEVEVIITGEVAGIGFEGSDTISRVITPTPHGRGEWARVSTPTTEGWVLAPDSIIIDYAVADEGDVAYAIVYSDATGEFHLLKSTDSAATWMDIIDSVEDALDDNDYINYFWRVATDNSAPDFLAVMLDMWDDSDGANEVHVFISDEGGATFEDAGEVEDGGVYFPDGYHVSDLEVSPEANGKREIAIGGKDNYGDAALFRCTVTGDSAGAWEDATNYLGDYPGWDDGGSPIPPSFTSLAVVDIHFAPNWAADKTILVTTVTETGMDIYTVHLQSGTWGTSDGWNEWSILGIEAVPIMEDVDIPIWLADFDARRIAGITVPSDYNGRSMDTRKLWVWVNYYDPFDGPVGKIFRVKNKSVMEVNQQIEDLPWLTNISYKGTIAEGEAIAGVLGTGIDDPLFTEDCEGVQVFRNDGVAQMDICCIFWEEACKPPTGTFAMAVSYVGEDKAYAVSLWGFFSPYDEDAWSVSSDDGDCWNQLSLVDTHIDYLSDVTVSPDCNKTMLVSVNEESGCGCDSVWLHAENLPEAPEYSGKWLRTWCGELEGDMGGGWERGLLKLNPEETTGYTIYLVDYGTSIAYWSELEGLDCWNRGAASVDHIVDLALLDKETIFAVDYYGHVAMSDYYAIGWHEPVDSEVEYGWTIAVHGDHVLVGGCDSDVSYSDDGGEMFTELEQVPVSADYTLVTVAFDSYFDANDTIYAAVAGFVGSSPTTGGIYRWVIGESVEWEDLGAEDYAYTGLVLNAPSGGKPETSPDTGGVLYASYVSGATTGVARCLTPAQDACCSATDWDYLTKGLTSELFKMTPQALKICNCLTAHIGSRLFAIDSSDYYDMVDGLTGTVWSFDD